VPARPVRKVLRRTRSSSPEDRACSALPPGSRATMYGPVFLAGATKA
jgi:hypothetical protein